MQLFGLSRTDLTPGTLLPDGLVAQVQIGLPESGGELLSDRPPAIQGRTRSLSGVVTATWLVLDSAGPPAGPPAPRLSLKDEAVGGAESRPRTGPRGAHRPHEHFTTGEAQELDRDE